MLTFCSIGKYPGVFFNTHIPHKVRTELCKNFGGYLPLLPMVELVTDAAESPTLKEQLLVLLFKNWTIA